MTGLYREDQKDPNRHPFNITHVTVVLDRGKDGKTTEDWEVRPAVVEGESRALQEDETDSEENHDHSSAVHQG